MNSSFLLCFLSLLSTKNQTNEKSSMKVLSYNATPFILFDSSAKRYSGIEFELIETIAKYFNLSVEYNVASPFPDISIDER